MEGECDWFSEENFELLLFCLYFLVFCPSNMSSSSIQSLLALNYEQGWSYFIYFVVVSWVIRQT